VRQHIVYSEHCILWFVNYLKSVQCNLESPKTVPTNLKICTQSQAHPMICVPNLKNYAVMFTAVGSAFLNE